MTKKEIKILFSKEIKELNQSRLTVIVGLLLLVTNVVLVILTITSIYTLIFILPLLYILRKQFREFQMKKMVYDLSRCIVDEEFYQNYMK